MPGALGRGSGGVGVWTWGDGKGARLVVKLADGVRVDGIKAMGIVR